MCYILNLIKGVIGINVLKFVCFIDLGVNYWKCNSVIVREFMKCFVGIY